MCESLGNGEEMPSLSGHCLIVGAMKAGTTSLYDYFSGVEGIAVSRKKDTRFFVSETQGGNFFRGSAWYQEQFPPDVVCRIEASTHYTKWPDYSGVPERIHRTLIRPKFIYLVRDPVKRAISHYFHNLVVDGDVPEINSAFQGIESKYVIYSDYALQLRQYLQFFNVADFYIADCVHGSVSGESIGAALRFLDIPIDSRHSRSVSFRVRNSLSEKIRCRSECPDIHFSEGNRHAFRRLVEIQQSTGDRGLVNDALRFGLDHKVLSAVVKVLKRKADGFTEITGFTNASWFTW